MADFIIEVPISFKGGKDGEKVGKQIGDKVAEQIKKAYKSIGVGGKKTGGGEVGAISGLSKGLGKVALKLGALVAISAGILSVLKKASPYLAGILSVFGRAFSIFFRPFGDFLAALLRPLAVMLLRLAVKWLKWTRSPTGEAIGEAAKENIGLTGGDLTGGLWKNLKDLIKNIDWSKIKEFPGWLWEKLKSIWNYVSDFGSWFWGKITSIWNYVEDFGSWFWEKLKTIWVWTFDFGLWLWEKLTSIWSWSYDFAGWLWEKITSIFDNLNPIKNKTGEISSFFPTLGLSGGLTNLILKLIKGDYQTGTPFVQSDGLYNLHRGEQVIPRGQNNSKSVVLKPTFNIIGGVRQDIDMDAIVRRASRFTEMQLKQRGIL